ncbi:MAG TPA: hypothetical protein DEB06_02250 [Phycisphaerales bacterium]|nr:hypothetical protein [Phycisphaerales bacterium]
MNERAGCPRVMDRVPASHDSVYEARTREIWVMGADLARREHLPLRVAFVAFLMGVSGGAFAWVIEQVGQVLR